MGALEKYLLKEVVQAYGQSITLFRETAKRLRRRGSREEAEQMQTAADRLYEELVQTAAEVEKDRKS